MSQILRHQHVLCTIVLYTWEDDQEAILRFCCVSNTICSVHAIEYLTT